MLLDEIDDLIRQLNAKCLEHLEQANADGFMYCAVKVECAGIGSRDPEITVYLSRGGGTGKSQSLRALSVRDAYEEAKRDWIGSAT